MARKPNPKDPRIDPIANPPTKCPACQGTGRVTDVDAAGQVYTRQCLGPGPH